MTDYNAKVAAELLDIYDRDRRLTGRVQRRSDPIAPGDYFLVVHIILFNSHDQVLIQRRVDWKEDWAGMWDLSAAGVAQAGDDSRRAAERETLEELGLALDLSQERPRFTIYFSKGFDDYWIVQRDIDLADLRLQPEEVAEARWVTRAELAEMDARGEVIPYIFLDWLFDLREVTGARRKGADPFKRPTLREP